MQYSINYCKNNNLQLFDIKLKILRICVYLLKNQIQIFYDPTYCLG